MKYFFTSDEHYGHFNIISYCQRPFVDTEEMDNSLIARHNEVVGVDDVVYHLGDFTLKDNDIAQNYIRRLSGKHIFLKGSHDNWLPNDYQKILELKIDDQYLVLCHYAMKVWSRSHYNSWQLFGHSHGYLEEAGKQLDVGVDTNNFYPYSFEEIKKIMNKKEDNFNKVQIHEKRN